MSSDDIVARFAAIPPPPTSAGSVESFSAVMFHPGSPYRLAKNLEGRPYFLITTDVPSFHPAVRLENLEVAPAVRCIVTLQGGETKEETLAWIGCLSSEKSIRDYFLRLVSPLLDALPDPPSSESLGHAIELAVAVFRAMGAPPQKTIRGLWAELLLISVSADPAFLLSAWHREPGDLFDFSSGAERVEVKSAIEGRRHHFRLEQLREVQGMAVAVVSINVRSAGNGTSIETLVQRIENRAADHPAERAKVRRIVAETLGTDSGIALPLQFDEERAIDSVAIYSSRDIPMLRETPPAEVSEVRFLSDLSAAPRFQDSYPAGPLMRAVLTRERSVPR